MSNAPRRTTRVNAARRLLDDVETFSRYALNRPLRDYQLEVARAVVASVVQEEGLTFSVMFPRQAGKNELSAQLEAFLLHRYQVAGGSIVKCAPSFRPQIVNSLLRLERLLQDRLTVGRWRKRQGYIVQLGRASAFFFSAQPGSSVVGATASLLLEGDEAQDLDHHKWDKDFRPMGATGNATTVLYGTPWTDDTLLAKQAQLNRELEARDSRRRHFEVGWEAVAALNPAYGRHVQQEISRLGVSHPIVQTQYLLKALGRGGRFLDATQLQLLRGDHPPRLGPASGAGVAGVYVAGLDVAGADEEDPSGLLMPGNPRRDSTVLTVAFAEQARVVDLVVEPRLQIVRQYAWRGTPHRQLYPHILNLVRDHWVCRAVVVDATGIGSGLAAFLSAALGPRIVMPYVYTAASKSKLAYDFLAAINAGRLKLHTPTADTPELMEFFDQAGLAEYAMRPNQLMSFFVPASKGHDDLLNAAMLLVQATPLASHRVARGARTLQHSPVD